MGAVRQSFPRFRREGAAPRIELTEDDTDILRQVFRHRFIRADDLFRLFPERSPDRLSRRLMLLYRAGFLDRPISQVDRYREGGSQALVYGIDTAGARYLAETEGVSVGSGDWKARNRAYTRENLEHTLAVTRFLVDLKLGCRARADLDLIPFEEILAAAPEETRKSPFPGRWPVPVSWSGRTGTVQIAPDAIVGLRKRTADGKAVRTFFFVEIDRGTMTIAPAKAVRDSEVFLYRATILRKLLTYAQSHLQGLHAMRLGIPIARVLTLTTSVARAAAMREVAARFVVGPGKLPAELFLFDGASVDVDPLARCWKGTDNIAVRMAGDIAASERDGANYFAAAGYDAD